MMGTSVKTPTFVASAAGDPMPNNEIATATESSKKFDDPIIPAVQIFQRVSLKLLMFQKKL